MKLGRIAFIVTIAWIVLSFPIAYWDWQGRWHTSVLTSHYAFKLWLYWAQFAALPLLIALSLGQWWQLGWMRRLTKGIVCIGLVAMIWAGQIEPNLVRVRNTTIELNAPAGTPIKIALISDIHWGLFGRDWQLQRLIDRINSLDIDAVFVAGDWTYEPKLDLQAGFAPLKQLRVPIFAVLGNHDVEKPGPKLAVQLREALVANGVQFVEGTSIRWKGWQIIGLDDCGVASRASKLKRSLQSLSPKPRLTV